jgi:hypothetical protein
MSRSLSSQLTDYPNRTEALASAHGLSLDTPIPGDHIAQLTAGQTQLHCSAGAVVESFRKAV